MHVVTWCTCWDLLLEPHSGLKAELLEWYVITFMKTPLVCHNPERTLHPVHPRLTPLKTLKTLSYILTHT